jgi:hypothetical protein
LDAVDAKGERALQGEAASIAPGRRWVPGRGPARSDIRHHAPNPNTIRAEAKRENGSLAGEGTHVVAADGRRMVASTGGFDSQPRQFTMKTVWDRV